MRLFDSVTIGLLISLLCEFVSGTTECEACEQLVINKVGERKCVRRAQCCEHHGVQLTCLINPCFNFNNACPRAKHCVAAYCEKIGCTAFYYDSFYNPISNDECEVKVLKIGDIEFDGFIGRAKRFVRNLIDPSL
ncbi:unnamed protein product [Bursaphelenchus xylophilus]|uniref:(pine wood nematode) hypothetical protein n=1 Tax=Bursaphelenchus xylophilus TaxID=6326 RepID=A0A1I7RXX1_BURXY|nr:unnamed protein product [Bursaphelenchus xylophilus]CAG9125223.1 unnamed protein product [Bursaphelenchus xylophilus]